jgi:hypothetical protein
MLGLQRPFEMGIIGYHLSQIIHLKGTYCDIHALYKKVICRMAPEKL